MTYQKISASGLVINNKGELLMVKRALDDEFLPGVYELPGGGTDFNEDTVTSLKRELVEECGLEVDIEHPLTTFSFIMPHEGVEKHTVEIIYLCKLSTEQGVKLSHEHCDHKWVKFEEVGAVGTTEFMAQLISNLFKHPLIQSHLG